MPLWLATRLPFSRRGTLFFFEAGAILLCLVVFPHLSSPWDGASTFGLDVSPIPPLLPSTTCPSGSVPKGVDGRRRTTDLTFPDEAACSARRLPFPISPNTMVRVGDFPPARLPKTSAVVEGVARVVAVAGEQGSTPFAFIEDLRNAYGSNSVSHAMRSRQIVHGGAGFHAAPCMVFGGALYTAAQQRISSALLASMLQRVVGHVSRLRGSTASRLTAGLHPPAEVPGGLELAGSDLALFGSLALAYVDDFKVLTPHVLLTMLFREAFYFVVLDAKLQLALKHQLGLSVVFLGIGYDLLNSLVFLPEDKRIRYADRLRQLLGASRVSVDELEGILARLSWALAIFPGLRPYLGPCWSLLHARRLSHRFALSPAVKEFLGIYLEVLSGPASTDLSQSLGVALRRPVDAEWSSDASGKIGHGLGAFCNGVWFFIPTTQEHLRMLSISSLELIAEMAAVAAFAGDFAGFHVRESLDSEVVVGWLSGSRVGSAHDRWLLARRQVMLAERRLHLSQQHILRAGNRIADEASHDDGIGVAREAWYGGHALVRKVTPPDGIVELMDLAAGFSRREWEKDAPAGAPFPGHLKD